MKRKISILLSLIIITLPCMAGIMSISAANDEAKADIEAAFKRPAYASSLASDDRGWTPYLVDGKTSATDNVFSTKPKAIQGAEWVEVDLIAEINIRNVSVYFRSTGVCAPSDFTVDVWNGTKWVNLSSNKDFTYNGSALSITPKNRVNGSKVRLNATKLTKNENGQYALQLMEILVRGYASGNYYSHIPNSTTGNIAANAAANVSSSFENYGTYANHLTDSTGTVWSSQVYNKDTNDVWAEVLLDAVYTINSITLKPRFEREVIGFPKDFKISVWNNGKWTDVVTKTNFTAPVNGRIPAFSVSATASRIRVTATKLSPVDNVTTFNFQLAEILAAGAYSKELTPVEPDNSIIGNRELSPDFANDVALNKPVSSFSKWSQWSGPILNINDGKLNTFFSSNGNTYDPEKPEWVEINLLDNYEVEKVVFYGRPNNLGMPVDFTISIFYDGEWIEVIKENGYNPTPSGSPSENIFTFKKTVGNKIRVTATKMTPADGFSVLQIVELCAYGNLAEGNYVMSNENLASPTNLVSSSTSLEDWGFFKDMLIDGKLTTGFSTVPLDTPNAEEWVEIDFNMTVRVSEVQLKPARSGDGFPVDFTISLYANGSWIEVVNKKGFQTPTGEAMQIFRFTKRPTSKIKITATKLGSDYGRYDLKLNEVMVFAFQGVVVDENGDVINNTTSPDTGFENVTDTENKPQDEGNTNTDIYDENENHEEGTDEEITDADKSSGQKGSMVIKVPKQLPDDNSGLRVLLFVGIGLLVVSAGGGALFYFMLMRKTKTVTLRAEKSEN